MDNSLLFVENIYKSFDNQPVLRGITFGVSQGAIVALLGPSGSGKSTLLRCIAGLEQPDRGAIWFDGQRIDTVPPHARGFGLMFQQYALFPHRTVAENVAFGLRMQGWPRDRIQQRVAEMLALVGLEGYESRDVLDLSGGEQQRVALARSLAPQPRLLMLDEPLGALDRALRDRLLDEVRGILKHVGVTALYVTHDQQEAFAVGDWLVLLHEGRIVQQGMPEMVYRRPETPFAAQFFGIENMLQVERYGERSRDGVLVETALGPLWVAWPAKMPMPTLPAWLALRPEAAHIAEHPDTGANVVQGIMVERSFRGPFFHIRVRHRSGVDLVFDVTTTGTDIPPLGASVALRVRPDGMWLVPEVA